MAESKDLRMNIKALEKELTCGICKEIFQDPKLLPCSHYYCKECVVGLCPEKDDGDPLRCPECLSVPAISQDDVGSLKAASNISHLVDIHRSLLEAYDKERAKLPEESFICSEHGDFMMLYCQSCKCFICRDCAITKHKDHKYEYNSSAAVKRKEEIVQSKVFFLEISRDFKDALEDVRRILTALESQIRQSAYFLASYFKQLHDIIDQQETSVLESIQDIEDRQVGRLKEQENKLSNGCDDATKVLNQIKQHLSSNSCELIMSSRLQKLIESEKDKFKKYPERKYFSKFYRREKKYVNYDLVPAVNISTEVEVQLPSEFLSYSKDLVKIVFWKVPNSKNEIQMRGFQSDVLVNQKYSFDLLSEHERDIKGDIATWPPNSHTLRKCDINRIGSVTYLVEYISPLTPGEYQINVSFHGKSVTRVSLPLEVKEPS